MATCGGSQWAAALHSKLSCCRRSGRLIHHSVSPLELCSFILPGKMVSPKGQASGSGGLRCGLSLWWDGAEGSWRSAAGAGRGLAVDLGICSL